MKNNSLEFLIVGEFLANLKQEFGNGNNELVKIVKLKKVEQILIEEFKKGMNRIIWRKLIEAKYSPRSTEQWYKRVTNLNRH